MKSIRNIWIFAGALVAGLGSVLAISAYARLTEPPPAEPKAISTLGVKRLTGAISVSEQLRVDQVGEVKLRGFATVIDLRPDGEAEGQPSAELVKATANAHGLSFAYVPVPQGDIPDSAVDALNKAIADSPKPVLLYCRSGKRAARTWSLVEASRSGGASAGEILSAVKASGQSADDLAGAINARIAKRGAQPEAK